MKFNGIENHIKILEKDEKYIRLLSKDINMLEPTMARSIYEEIIRHSKEKNMYYVYSWAIHNLGWVYHDLNKLEKAILAHKTALRLFDGRDDFEGVLVSINALVANYSMQQLFGRALEYGINGLELAEKLGDYSRICTIKSNIALIYVEMEEYSKGREVIESIMSLHNIVSLKNQLVNYINLAECERGEGYYDKALEYLEKALEISKNHDKAIYPHVLDQMARAYTGKKLYSKANEIFEESVAISRERKHDLYLYEALLDWAELDLETGKINDALLKLAEIKENTKNVNCLRYKKRIYYNLSTGYSLIGNYKAAYEYLKKYNEILEHIQKAKEDDDIKHLEKKNSIEDEKAYKMLYKSTEEIYGLGQKITTNLNEEDIYNIIIDEISKLINFDFIFIGIVEDGLLKYKLARECGKPVEMKSKKLEEEGFGTYAVKYKQDIFINDINKDYYNYVKNLEEFMKLSTIGQNSVNDKYTKSMIFIPLVVGEKSIGVISTQLYMENAYTLKEVSILKILANYIGIALENSRLYKEIENNANYDSLTQILNRRAGLRRIEDIYNKNLSNQYILMLDVDNFKAINDTYGHDIGDEVLVAVAKEITASVGKNDVVARYGGEEFIAIINSEEYLGVAEEIRKNIAGITISTDDGHCVAVTASIGIVKLKNIKESLKKIISNADKALYKAKETGKNRFVVFEDTVI